MRFSRALFATAISLLAASGNAAIPARAAPTLPATGALRISLDQAGAERFQLRLLSGDARRPVFDSGVVAGNRGLFPLPPAAGAEPIFAELRVWDAAGLLLASRVSRLDEDGGLATHFSRLEAGLAAAGSTLQLDASAEVQGELTVAGALRTAELRSSAGAVFWGACSSGSAIRSIAANGSVLCEDDELQNHATEQNLQLAGYLLSGDGDDEGIFVGPGGNVGIGAALPLLATLRVEDVAQGRFTFSFPELPILRLRTYDSDPPVLSMESPAGSYSLRVTADNELQIGNSNPRLTVDGIGRMGIGTTDPAFYLHLAANSAAKPGSATWTVASDARLKQVEGPFVRGLEALSGIAPVRFHYRPDNPLALPSSPSHVGLLAQQVAPAIPEAVVEGPLLFLQLRTDPVLWTLLNAIRQLDLQQRDLAAAICRARPGSAACVRQPR